MKISFIEMDADEMLKKEEYLKKITSYLGALKSYIELNNLLSLADINKLSEDFFAELINKIYDLNLINMNLLQYNYPAIDLGDEASRICYQVTATSRREKIQNTLDKFNEYSLNEKYDELNILILTNKKNYNRKFNVYDTNFTTNNILDIGDLTKEISRIKSIKKIEEILSYLESELNDFSIESNSKDNNEEYEEAIINLINPEIKNNVSKILSQKTIIREVNLKFTLREVLRNIDEEKFIELRNDKGSFLFFGKLELTQYEKFESELLRLNTEKSKYIIELYSQFKLWNKYNDLFRMRKDEYALFRKVLFEELNKWEVSTKEIL